MIHQVPTNCMDTNCSYIKVVGLPDFEGEDEVCTVHYECALGFTEKSDCPYGQEEER